MWRVFATPLRCLRTYASSRGREPFVPHDQLHPPDLGNGLLVFSLDQNVPSIAPGCCVHSAHGPDLGRGQLGARTNLRYGKARSGQSLCMLVERRFFLGLVRLQPDGNSAPAKSRGRLRIFLGEATSLTCPLYARKQTSTASRWMSAKCQSLGSRRSLRNYTKRTPSNLRSHTSRFQRRIRG